MLEHILKTIAVPDDVFAEAATYLVLTAQDCRIKQSTLETVGYGVAAATIGGVYVGTGIIAIGILSGVSVAKSLDSSLRDRRSREEQTFAPPTIGPLPYLSSLLLTSVGALGVAHQIGASLAQGSMKGNEVGLFMTAGLFFYGMTDYLCRVDLTKPRRRYESNEEKTAAQKVVGDLS